MTTKTFLDTSRFGRLEYCDADIVEFSGGLLGFETRTRFVLIQHKEGSPFRWMQCLDDGNLAFLVVDPAVYVGNYAPVMPSSVADELNMSEDSPRLVYTIATIPAGRPKDMTLNLAGPLLIHAETGKAKQIVLDTETYSLRFRVFAEESGETSAA